MSEINFIELKCQRCGGELEEKGINFVCASCGKKWHKENVNGFADMLEACEEALRNQRVADISNLRQLLWKEVHNEYVSNVKVSEYCTDILKYLPQDFYANFYLSMCSKNKTAAGEFLSNVDVERQYDDIELILDYVIKALKPEWIMGVGNFIEKVKDIDTALYHKYRTLFEEECKKLDDCVFTADFPRDVFVAYSSADMAQVSRLVTVLEAEKLTCFVAARNMRHGSGSVDNYEKLLHTAIDSCSVVVFVSSDNSRSTTCDAYTELGYISANHNDMPRVEYVIKNYGGKAAERYFKNFFKGHEYCLSPEDVAARVADIIMNQGAEPVPEPVQASVPVQTPAPVQVEPRRENKENKIQEEQAPQVKKGLFASWRQRKIQKEEDRQRLLREEEEERLRKIREEEECQAEEERKAILNIGDFKDLGGGYITFGAYPQRRKATNVKIGELYDGEREYYLGSDKNLYAEWQGEYYKVEPIKWKVLSHGSEWFIVSEQVLDQHRFDGKSNNYANSEIRKWLNDEFYNKAFREGQKSKIVTSEVDNSLASTGDRENKYVCENTNDKVFFLSLNEVNQYFTSNNIRLKKTTGYTIARGCGNGKSTYSRWWLRSPSCYNDDEAYCISDHIRDQRVIERAFVYANIPNEYYAVAQLHYVNYVGFKNELSCGALPAIKIKV